MGLFNMTVQTKQKQKIPITKLDGATELTLPMVQIVLPVSSRFYPV
jgi:hypothetical protein